MIHQLRTGELSCIDENGVSQQKREMALQGEMQQKLADECKCLKLSTSEKGINEDKAICKKTAILYLEAGHPSC